MVGEKGVHVGSRDYAPAGSVPGWSGACMEFEDLCSYITWTKGSLIIGLFDLHSMRTN